MRRSVAPVLAPFLLALPAAALAQSAGDEQYADPFGQTEEPERLPGEAPSDTRARRPRRRRSAAAPAQEQAVVHRTGAPTLPRTGPPAHLLAGAGALLLAAGGTLRRLVL